jgi:hypothetical protein
MCDIQKIVKQIHMTGAPERLRMAMQHLVASLCLNGCRAPSLVTSYLETIDATWWIDGHERLCVDLGTGDMGQTCASIIDYHGDAEEEDVFIHNIAHEPSLAALIAFVRSIAPEEVGDED